MLEKLKGTFDKSVTAVSVKSETLVESSRVRSQIATAQKNLDAGLAALGSTLYNNWLAGDVQMEALTAECERLKAFADEIEGHKARLEQIKQEESKLLGTKKSASAPAAVFCTNCGAKLSPGTRFCNECGTQVKQ
ncbi:MAG: zinc ribbon domain-containing protein [Oscillospiraceae bacterium]|nr:zinc ribbon domain-containing protein [Oscillospiraceae bacterium]